MTTTVVKTIRASGGDYTTLSAWEAANQGDLVTADEIRVAECYNDWPSGLVDSVTIAGSTTDATRYMMITVAAGHRHNGTPQSGFYFKKALDWTGLLVATDANFRAEYLDIWNTGGNGVAYNVNNALLTSCLGRGAYRAFFDIKSGLLRNCLGYGSTIGFEFVSWFAPRVYNCVAAGCTTGFSSSTGGGTDRILSNCVSYGNTTNYAGVWSSSSSNNASSAASGAPGTSPVHSVTSAAFADSANNNFHLAAGSVLIGAGANLYSTFTTDVDGDAWPSSGAWDIGFDYYVSSGGSTSLTIADSTHGHATDSFALTSASLLSVSDAFHAHLADNLGLDTAGATSLTIGDAAHLHVSDAMVLTSEHVLAIVDVLHTHLADSVVLNATGTETLAIAEALHAHMADALVITTDSILAIADALHQHLSDGPVLGIGFSLVITGAGHAHSVDSIVLSLGVPDLPLSARIAVIEIGIGHEQQGIRVAYIDDCAPGMRAAIHNDTSSLMFYPGDELMFFPGTDLMFDNPPSTYPGQRVEVLS